LHLFTLMPAPLSPNHPRSAPSRFLLIARRPPKTTLFPYTTLFRSRATSTASRRSSPIYRRPRSASRRECLSPHRNNSPRSTGWRSEEHTSELQSRVDLVCRLLLEKKNGWFHYVAN